MDIFQGFTEHRLDFMLNVISLCWVMLKRSTAKNTSYIVLPQTLVLRGKLSYVQCAVGDPAWQEGWTRWSSDAPSNLSHCSDGAAFLCVYLFLNDSSVLPSKKKKAIKNQFYWAKYKCLERFWRKSAYSPMNSTVCYKNHCWCTKLFMHLFFFGTKLYFVFYFERLLRRILLIFQYLDGSG